MNEKSEESKPERTIYILRDDECQPCDELEETNKAKIESGEIKVLMVNTDEALKLLAQAGNPDKMLVPSAVVKDKDGIRLCEVHQSKDFTLIACGNKIIALREPTEEQLATWQLEESPLPPTD